MGIKNTEGLSIGQAAQALGVSAKTIRRHIKEGKLPFKLVEGKYGNEYRIIGLPTQGPTPDLQALDIGIAQALDMVKVLQTENRDLAGALGSAQEKVRQLEAQVKLLTEGRRPWWRRIFRR